MGVRGRRRPPAARLPRWCDRDSIAPLARVPLTPCRVRPRVCPRGRASQERRLPPRPPAVCLAAAWARWAW
eukprot:5733475-Prymnesium_polylepis.1